MKVTLEALKELIIANTNVKPTIEFIWIDFGAGWKQDTLVAPKQNNHFSYQMIAPMDLIKIRKGEYTIENAQELINKINERGW
jgi:hypothetical protein